MASPESEQPTGKTWQHRKKKPFPNFHTKTVWQLGALASVGFAHGGIRQLILWIVETLQHFFGAKLFGSLTLVAERDARQESLFLQSETFVEKSTQATNPYEALNTH